MMINIPDKLILRDKCFSSKNFLKVRDEIEKWHLTGSGINSHQADGIVDALCSLYADAFECGFHYHTETEAQNVMENKNQVMAEIREWLDENHPSWEKKMRNHKLYKHGFDDRDIYYYALVRYCPISSMIDWDDVRKIENPEIDYTENI